MCPNRMLSSAQNLCSGPHSVHPCTLQASTYSQNTPPPTSPCHNPPSSHHTPRTLLQHYSTPQVQDVPRLLARLQSQQGRPESSAFRQLHSSIGQLLAVRQLVATLAPGVAASVAAGSKDLGGQGFEEELEAEGGEFWGRLHPLQGGRRGVFANARQEEVSEWGAVGGADFDDVGLQRQGRGADSAAGGGAAQFWSGSSGFLSGAGGSASAGVAQQHASGRRAWGRQGVADGVSNGRAWDAGTVWDRLEISWKILASISDDLVACEWMGNTSTHQMAFASGWLPHMSACELLQNPL